MNDVLNRRRAATRHGRNYSWAELMKRDWAIDVLACPRCQGRMRLLAESIHPSPYEKRTSTPPPNRMPLVHSCSRSGGRIVPVDTLVPQFTGGSQSVPTIVSSNFVTASNR